MEFNSGFKGLMVTQAIPVEILCFDSGVDKNSVLLRHDATSVGDGYFPTPQMNAGPSSSRETLNS